MSITVPIVLILQYNACGCKSWLLILFSYCRWLNLLLKMQVNTRTQWRSWILLQVITMESFFLPLNCMYMYMYLVHTNVHACTCRAQIHVVFQRVISIWWIISHTIFIQVQVCKLTHFLMVSCTHYSEFKLYLLCPTGTCIDWVFILLLGSLKLPQFFGC